MEQVHAPAPSVTAVREIEPLGVFPVVAHLSMFAAFAWTLALVPDFKVIFDDLGMEPPASTAIVMAMESNLQSIGLSLWTLAVVGLLIDFGVCWSLRQRGHRRAAHNWMWLVAAGVIPAAVALQRVLILPLITLTNSMK